MSCSLPPEILGLVLDQLHDESATLKACCVVSKSWVPPARRHLFARLTFGILAHQVESWMKAFPDPSTTPARHTRSLSIRGFPIINATDEDVGDWIRTFHNVVDLHLEHVVLTHHEALAPYCGFSHMVRSLRLTSTSFEIFDLVCSFPLLEDLALVSLLSHGAAAEWNAPSTSPKLTGSLELSAVGGIRFATRRLLDFPDGLCFTNIAVSCIGSDFESATDLVSRCSRALESLTLNCSFLGTPKAPFPDLSRASKLKDLTFVCTASDVSWITAALQTVEPGNLQQITIILRREPQGDATERTIPRQRWQDLDRLLVQLCTSYSICPRVVYTSDIGPGANRRTLGSLLCPGEDTRERDTRDYVLNLLPELANRGLVRLVQRTPPSTRTTAR